MPTPTTPIRHSTGKIIGLALAAGITALLALGGLAAGGGLLWANGERDTDGYVKLVVAPGRLGGPDVLDRVVGLTAVCPHGGELAGTAALAMQTGMLAARLAQTVAPYPT